MDIFICGADSESTLCSMKKMVLVKIHLHTSIYSCSLGIPLDKILTSNLVNLDAPQSKELSIQGVLKRW